MKAPRRQRIKSLEIEGLAEQYSRRLRTATDSRSQEGAASDRGDLLPRDAGEEGALRKGLGTTTGLRKRGMSIDIYLPKP
jgi:hypothetical protein